MTITQSPDADSPTLTRVTGGPLYGEIQAFLIDEANLLNDDRQSEWLALLTEDVYYRMPVRKTTYRADGRGFDTRRAIYSESWHTLALRVRRNEEITNAYDRDPLPRTRRLVGNVVVFETETDGDYVVRSAVLLLWNRFDEGSDLLSAEREDVLRRTADGLRLAKRVVHLDQALLPAHYTNILI